MIGVSQKLLLLPNFCYDSFVELFITVNGQSHPLFAEKKKKREAVSKNKKSYEYVAVFEPYVCNICEDCSTIYEEGKNPSTPFKSQSDEESDRRQRKGKLFDDAAHNKVYLLKKDKIPVEIFNRICNRLAIELGQRHDKLHIFNIFQNLFTVQRDKLSFGKCFQYIL